MSFGEITDGASKGMTCDAVPMPFMYEQNYLLKRRQIIVAKGRVPVTCLPEFSFSSLSSGWTISSYELFAYTCSTVSFGHDLNEWSISSPNDECLLYFEGLCPPAGFIFEGWRPRTDQPERAASGFIGVGRSLLTQTGPKQGE